MFALAVRAAAPILAALALAACNQQQGAAGGGASAAVDPYLGPVILGSESAPVHVTEFHSLSCSHCRDFWKQDFQRIKAEFIDTGKVKWEFRDYPTDPDIAVAGIAIARCKGKDNYYPVIDEFFSKQYDIFEAARTGGAGAIIVGIAEKFGVSQAEARACTDSKAIRDHITAEMKVADTFAEEAKLPRTPGTPALYVGKEYVTDHRYPALSATLNAALGAPAAPAAAGAAPAPAAPATPPSE